MSDTSLQRVSVHIVSPTDGRLPPLRRLLGATSTLRDLLALLMREQKLPARTDWTFRTRDGAPLDLSETLGEVAERFNATGDTLELTALCAIS